jgi:hypothetical protein
MAYARGFGLNGKSLYTNVTMPKNVWLNFIVDSPNGNGLGVRSLKSNGFVEYVFMHTSTTPGSQNGHLNPNPPSGYAIVCFKNNFNKYLGGFNGFIVPAVNTAQTSVTQNSVYIITSLGTATLAQWQAKGLLPGFVPAVGGYFVATATGTIGGSATVGSPGVPLGLQATVVGDPNQMLNNSNIASNAGAVMVIQFAAPTISGSNFQTPLLATAPADNSVVGMQFCFDGSSVTIDGL